jgi:hypothetical protein
MLAMGSHAKLGEQLGNWGRPMINPFVILRSHALLSATLGIITLQICFDSHSVAQTILPTAETPVSDTAARFKAYGTEYKVPVKYLKENGNYWIIPSLTFRSAAVKTESRAEQELIRSDGTLDLGRITQSDRDKIEINLEFDVPTNDFDEQIRNELASNPDLQTLRNSPLPTSEDTKTLLIQLEGRKDGKFRKIGDAQEVDDIGSVAQVTIASTYGDVKQLRDKQSSQLRIRAFITVRSIAAEPTIQLTATAFAQRLATLANHINQKLEAYGIPSKDTLIARSPGLASAFDKTELTGGGGASVTLTLFAGATDGDSVRSDTLVDLFLSETFTAQRNLSASADRTVVFLLDSNVALSTTMGTLNSAGYKTFTFSNDEFRNAAESLRQGKSYSKGGGEGAISVFKIVSVGGSGNSEDSSESLDQQKSQNERIRQNLSKLEQEFTGSVPTLTGISIDQSQHLAEADSKEFQFTKQTNARRVDRIVSYVLPLSWPYDRQFGDGKAQLAKITDTILQHIQESPVSSITRASVKQALTAAGFGGPADLMADQFKMFQVIKVLSGITRSTYRGVRSDPGASPKDQSMMVTAEAEYSPPLQVQRVGDSSLTPIKIAVEAAFNASNHMTWFNLNAEDEEGNKVDNIVLPPGLPQN